MSAQPIFRQVEIFRGLSDDELQSIIALATVETYNNGDIIFEQGSPGTNLCVILSGQVEIRQKHISGEDHSIVFLGSGQILGEMGLIDEVVRSASAIAVSDNTTISCIDATQFNRFCDENRTIGYIIMRHIAQDLSFKIRHRDFGQWRKSS